MAVNVVLNGVSYSIPDPGDSGWGQDLTDYFVAQASGLLQKSGGTFTLTAEVDFGATFGLKSVYFKSRATNPASAGQVRLGNTESVSWRNAANSSNLALSVDSSDNLTYNGVVISSSSGIVPPTSGGTGISTYATGDTLYASASNVLSKLTIGATSKVLNVTGGIPAWSFVVDANVDPAAAIAYSKLALTGSIVNADINASAAIAYSKLALTGSIVNADLANMATNTIKGNNTGGSAAPTDLTGTQVTALLSNFVGDSGSGGTKGLVPAPATGDAAAGKFLKANGGWAVPSGAGTVTSVGVAGVNGLSFTGSPVTTSGTIQAVLTPPLVTKYTSGSGTHTFTGSPLCVEILAIGAGGGGGGGGASGVNGTAGGDTTFASITAGGGHGGSAQQVNVGAANAVGGTASLGSGPTGIPIPGSSGGVAGGGAPGAGGDSPTGGNGGASAIGGSGGGGGVNGTGTTAATNSGSGGGGGGGGSAAGYAGGGGASGGFVKAKISGAALAALSGSASYGVGSGGGGGAGTAGNGGGAGAPGADGLIEVTEYYQ